jgi:hypothetical protein
VNLRTKWLKAALLDIRRPRFHRAHHCDSGEGQFGRRLDGLATVGHVQ